MCEQGLPVEVVQGLQTFAVGCMRAVCINSFGLLCPEHNVAVAIDLVLFHFLLSNMLSLPHFPIKICFWVLTAPLPACPVAGARAAVAAKPRSRRVQPAP
jgi:hypothetical protein